MHEEMSDVFFNYQHERFNSLPHGKSSLSDLRAAITLDAEDFVALHPKLCQSADWTSKELAENFLLRI